MAYKTVTITFSDGRSVKVMDHKFTSNIWGELSEVGANSQSDGLTNTTSLIESYRNIAGNYIWNDSEIQNYFNKGYYVPSIKELEEIWMQKTKFTDLNCDDCLWSSTEEGVEGAWRVYFKMRHDASDALNKQFSYSTCMMKDI